MKVKDFISMLSELDPETDAVMSTPSSSLTRRCRLPGADKYATEFSTIDGWFWSLDVEIIDEILARQLDETVTGDILEIGCYAGRTAILLGYGLRDDETLHICDLFAAADTHEHIAAASTYPPLVSVEKFTTNYSRYHDVPPAIHICDSADLRERIHTPLRFTHIDGCHSYSCVENDIRWVVERTIPSGVVVMDDYRDPNFSGVAAAAWEKCATKELYPFCLTDSKMYAAVSESGQHRWLETMLTLGYKSGVQPMLGLDVARVQHQ